MTCIVMRKGVIDLILPKKAKIAEFGVCWEREGLGIYVFIQINFCVQLHCNHDCTQL